MNKKLEVLQEECSDCGICSLASIIKYYKGSISLETLRFYTGTNNNGTNAYELINCAQKFGFNAYGEKCNDLSLIKKPVIAHLKLENDFYHFVVIYKINKDIITIMDPSFGIKKIKLDEFYQIYTGVIIHFIPINTIPKYKKSRFLQEKLILEIQNNKKTYFMLIFISLIMLLFTIINNFEIKILSYNKNLFYILLLFIIIKEIIIYLKNIILLNNSINFNNSIIKEFVIHIFKLPLYYLKLKQKGEISTRFNELNNLTNNIINIFVEIIFSILLCLITNLIIISISFQIFLIMMLMTFIYILININIYKKLVKEIKYSINLEENYNSNILDYISNFNTIKHLNIYNFFINNISKNLKERNKITKKINKKIYFISLYNNILFGIILLLILNLVINNSYSLSNSLLIYVLINFYITNLKSLIETYPNLLIIKTYINKSNDFLSFKEEIKRIKIDDFSNITIKNLFYRINENIVLKNINYEINNKDKIFINGPSGIGKSTLMKILNNEINRYNGNILIDNKEIRKYNLDNLITYVSQNESIFNDTIYNNIILNQKIKEEELNKILKITRLNEINIIKTLGLNTLIINDNSLSGGEKNRLILARSLIHSKKILILDEVLKEVDESLEIDIIKDIIEYYKDKTIIYISHKNVGYLFDKVLTFRKEQNSGIRK